MAPPGMVLSQPTRATMASNMWPRPTSSMESATTSRLIREAFIPSVPIVTPSEMAMVLSSIGVPPAARTPAFTFSAQRPQVEIARHGLNPSVGDADNRLGQVLVREPDGLQHRARRGTVATISDDVTVLLQIARHSSLPCMMNALWGKCVMFSDLGDWSKQLA